MTVEATTTMDVEAGTRWIRTNAGYFGTIGDDPETMADAFRDHFDPSSGLEQCSLCGGWFPDPVELHHTPAECEANSA